MSESNWAAKPDANKKDCPLCLTEDGQHALFFGKPCPLAPQSQAEIVKEAVAAAKEITELERLYRRRA